MRYYCLVYTDSWVRQVALAKHGIEDQGEGCCLYPDSRCDLCRGEKHDVSIEGHGLTVVVWAHRFQT